MTFVIAPIPVAPIPVAPVAPVVTNTKKCATEGCTSMLVEGKAFVPPIDELYRRCGIAKNEGVPLARAAVLNHEMCFACLEGKGMDKTFLLTREVLDRMEKLVERNLRRIEQADKLKLQQELMARRTKKRVHHSHAGEDMLDVIAESAKRQAKFETRKRHHRLPAAERRRLAETKSSRSFTPTPSKNGKKKSDDNKGKRGRK